MNKTYGNAIPRKLTNLQPALKKLINEKPGARFVVVRSNCFRKLITFFYKFNCIRFVCSFFFVLSRLPACLFH